MLKGMLRVLDDYISTPTVPQAEFSAAYNNVEQAIMASIPEGHRHLLRGSAAKGQNENKPAQGNSSNKDIQRKKPVITAKENTKSVHQSGDHQSDTSNIDNNNHKYHTNDQKNKDLDSSLDTNGNISQEQDKRSRNNDDIFKGIDPKTVVDGEPHRGKGRLKNGARLKAAHEEKRPPSYYVTQESKRAKQQISQCQAPKNSANPSQY